MREPSDTRRPGRHWLPYLLAAILLAGVVYSVPVREIWGALRTSHPMPLAVALAILLGSRLLASVRTKALTDAQGLCLSILRIFEISCASTLYGMALPGSLSGGIVRWYRLSRPNGNRSGALAVLAAERAVDYFVLALVGILCWVADASLGRQPVVAWALAAVACVCLLINVEVFSGLTGSTDRRARALGLPLAWRPEAVVRGLTGLASACAQYRAMGRRKVFLLFAVSSVFHVVVTVSQYLMAVSLGLGVSLVSVGWIRACTVLLTAVPVTPSGLGVREVSLVLLLLPLGVSAAQAVAFSLLQLAGLLLIALIGALFDVRRYWRAPMNGQTARLG
jgi:uncharacterized protein (TIRG00374 family)